MDIRKQIFQIAMCILLCAAPCALAQNAPAPTATIQVKESSGPNCLIPEQLAQFNADQDCRNDLDKKAISDMKAHNFAEAETDARIALGVGGDDGTADYIFAEALELQGKNSEAVVQFKKLADKGEFRQRLLLPYSGLLLKEGRVAEAVAVYNKAEPPLTQDETEQFMSGLGSSDYLLRGSFKFTLDRFDTVSLATAIHIGVGVWMDEVGAAVPGIGLQTDLAMDQYAQAHQLMPNSDVAQYYCGFGLEKVGRLPEAKEAYTEAVRMGGDAVKAAANERLDCVNRLIKIRAIRQASPKTSPAQPQSNASVK